VEQASSLPCPANNPAKISRNFLAAIDRQDARPTTGSKYPLRISVEADKFGCCPPWRLKMRRQKKQGALADALH
jgi:hypothetical protein